MKSAAHHVILLTLGGVMVLASIVLPIIAILHLSDTDHYTHDYLRTIPPQWKFKGIRSARTNPLDGWINPGTNTTYVKNNTSTAYIYDPKYILDIGGCLSRALFNNMTPGHHHRLSLCRSTTSWDRNVDIRLQRHFGNDHNDISNGGLFGVTLDYEEFVSLVKMYKWVEMWMFRRSPAAV